MASRDVAMAWQKPTSQPVLVLPEAVGVSVVSVDATLGQRDRFQPDDWTRSGSGLPRREGRVVDECADCAGGGGLPLWRRPRLFLLVISLLE